MTGVTLEILQPGPLALVEDLGRPGLSHLGVTRSGAADRRSHTLANRLVANPDDRATVEVDGRILRLRPRQSEIMVTLALAKVGRSASRLAVDLCAGELRPVTVRAEVSRLRAALGAEGSE